MLMGKKIHIGSIVVVIDLWLGDMKETRSMICDSSFQFIGLTTVLSLLHSTSLSLLFHCYVTVDIDLVNNKDK